MRAKKQLFIVLEPLDCLHCAFSNEINENATRTQLTYAVDVVADRIKNT